MSTTGQIGSAATYCLLSTAVVRLYKYTQVYVDGHVVLRGCVFCAGACMCMHVHVNANTGAILAKNSQRLRRSAEFGRRRRIPMPCRVYWPYTATAVQQAPVMSFEMKESQIGLHFLSIWGSNKGCIKIGLHFLSIWGSNKGCIIISGVGSEAPYI